MKSIFTRIVAAALIACSLSFAPAARAADMTNYLENKLVDALFRGVAFTMPTVIAIALHTAACSDSSAGTEVTTAGSTGYLRVTRNPATTNWSATDTSSSTAATSGGTTGTTYNIAALQFPTATANWGTVSHFSVWDNATVGAGNMLFCKALSGGSQAVNSGSTPSFAAGALSVQIDN